ncbi:unnamed protein product [[Candida] boidinii]|uniref:Unnamed protein product n=1 Tax=Candida boidinii TaxID=5477 RepID=A0A9W6T2P9_CANBO|nr:unnamed protein product [[Candida] boidinii]
MSSPTPTSASANEASIEASIETPSTPKLSASNTPTPIASPKSDITSNGLNSPLASTDSIINNSTIDEKLSIDSSNTTATTTGTATTTTGPLTTTNSFEKALNDWTIIDLPNLQKELDLNGLEIQDFTKKSLISKKELATKTKQFKKLEKDEKLNQINPLLKLYQNEIDSLTKKNKNIENIFFKIYRLIAEAPDPKPLLKISLNAVTSIDEFEKINEEKEELENKLLNYLDYDQLKIQIEKLKNDSKIELKNQLNLKENEFQSLINEKILNWEKEKSDYKDKISKMTNQIEELKINEQVIKLKLKKQLNTLDRIDYDHDDDDNELINDKDIEGKTTEILDLNETDKSNLKLNTSKNLEIDILKKDIDSYKSRINNLESRNENLIKELTVSKSNIEINKINNENNEKIKVLENENLILLGRLNNERKNFDNSIKKNNKKIDSLNMEINSLNNEIKHLKKRYNETIDYDEIKKELEIIKEIEFGELNMNDNDEDENTKDNKKSIIKKLSSSSRTTKKII